MKNEPGQDRKTMQLLRQVEETLHLVLYEHIEHDVEILSVLPAPDARRMVVTLMVDDPGMIEEVQESLEEAAGDLRMEVAESISRKRAPTLVFRVVPEPPVEE